METFIDTSGVGAGKSHHARLRTVDVARACGYSVQQIRKLEADGAIPPATRAANGYRAYTRVHVLAAVAYRRLASGTGPVEAKELLRTASSRPESALLAALDAVHARLHGERRDLALAEAAVATIAAEPTEPSLPSDTMTVTELAEALGVRSSTLRHWDAEGLVVPGRKAPGRARAYSPTDVRDARIVHQLRLAGYGIEVLRELLPRLRLSRNWDEAGTALDARRANIATRSRALLDGAAALCALLDATGEDAPD